jgi:hypothetical protein
MRLLKSPLGNLALCKTLCLKIQDFDIVLNLLYYQGRESRRGGVGGELL